MIIERLQTAPTGTVSRRFLRRPVYVLPLSLSVPGHDRPRRVEPDLGLVAILWQMLIDVNSSIETRCKHE